MISAECNCTRFLEGDQEHGTKYVENTHYTGTNWMFYLQKTAQEVRRKEA